MDFTVIARGGLKQTEFSALVGVSRVTTNLWVRGKMSPHRFIKAKVAAVLAHLQSAIENGELPLQQTDATQRLHALLAIVRQRALRAKEAKECEAAAL